MRGKRFYSNSFRDLFVLSLPTFVSFSLQNLYALVDIFWISRLGTSAIAAVSLASVVNFIIFTVSQTIAVGATAYVSQLKGKKNWEGILSFSAQAISLALYSGLLLSILVFLFPAQAMRLMGARGEVINLGRAYLLALAPFIVFFTLNFAINSLFRATGDTFTPMFILIISNLTNIILDPILIFGMKMGVKGAAVATGISYALAFSYGLLKLIRLLGANPFIPHHPDLSLAGKILKVGLPSGIQFTLMSLTMIVLLRIVAGYGKAVVAAVGVAGRIMHFVQIPLMSLAISSTIVAGQYLGMGEEKEAERTVLKILFTNVVLMGIMVLLIFPLAPPLMGFFSKEITTSGAEVLRFFLLAQVFVAVNVSISSAFRASGDTLPPLYVSMGRVSLLIALAPALSHFFSLRGIWYAMVTSAFLSSLLSLIFFIKRNWKARAVSRFVEVKT